MISYGGGLVFPDAWGDRPEEELEDDEQATREVAEDIAEACGGTVRETDHWFVIDPHEAA